MSSIKGHFDGTSIVLDEAPPATLAVGQQVRIVVDTQPVEDPAPRQSRFGFAKGMFEMRDDFDDPLDEFAEYR